MVEGLTETTRSNGDQTFPKGQLPGPDGRVDTSQGPCMDTSMCNNIVFDIASNIARDETDSGVGANGHAVEMSTEEDERVFMARIDPWILPYNKLVRGPWFEGHESICCPPAR